MSEKYEGEPKPVNGYLILDSRGNFLEHSNLTWFDHEGNYKDAYVYTREQLDEILEDSEKWPTRPSHVIEATWNPKSGVVAHEHDNKLRIPISELPPVDQK